MMAFDFGFVITHYGEFLDPAWITIQLSVFSLILGFIIGSLAAIVRVVKIPVISQIFFIYVEIMRETPLLVQFFFWHFAIPPLTNYTFNPPVFIDALLALGLNSGAYQSEIVRAGILAIPEGQWEASKALGFNRIKTFRFVIMPQAYRIIIPPLANEFINLILNSSLASTIAYIELTYKGKFVATRTFKIPETWAIVASYYFIICFSLSRVMKKVEERLKIPGLGTASM
ncbi:MAG: amino acid ABC transporter permease [Candidatus Hodarchaeales archaeon]|jgi:polar amino acid transport system permease protein